MNYLSKEAILTADDLPFEDVEVSQWGGTVRIRSITALDRDAFEVGFVKDRESSTPNIRARFVAACLVNPETGERVFTNAEADSLGKKNGGLIDKLYSVAQRLNKLTEEDVEALVKT